MMAGKDHVIAGSPRNRAQVSRAKLLPETARRGCGPRSSPSRTAVDRRRRPAAGCRGGYRLPDRSARQALQGASALAFLVHHVRSIPALRGAFDGGGVTAPGDPGYDQARKVFYGNGTGTRRPSSVPPTPPGSRGWWPWPPMPGWSWPVRRRPQLGRAQHHRGRVVLDLSAMWMAWPSTPRAAAPGPRRG